MEIMRIIMSTLLHLSMVNRRVIFISNIMVIFFLSTTAWLLPTHLIGPQIFPRSRSMSRHLGALGEDPRWGAFSCWWEAAPSVPLAGLSRDSARVRTGQLETTEKPDKNDTQVPLREPPCAAQVRLAGCSARPGAELADISPPPRTSTTFQPGCPPLPPHTLVGHFVRGVKYVLGASVWGESRWRKGRRNAGTLKRAVDFVRGMHAPVS